MSIVTLDAPVVNPAILPHEYDLCFCKRQFWEIMQEPRGIPIYLQSTGGLIQPVTSDGYFIPHNHILSIIAGLEAYLKATPEETAEAHNRPRMVARWAETESSLSRAAEAAPAPLEARAGYLYLLRSDHGVYKIGRSKTPKRRVETLGVQLPFAVTPEHFIKCGDVLKAEALLHQKYAEKRQRGEWFSLNLGDVAFIKAINTISAGGDYNE